MISGTVFDIQHFCLDDGPGIRTTVFLKGCPLRCIWCHNAEGLSRKVQLYFNAENCTGCLSCETACGSALHRFNNGTHSVDFKSCLACGSCVSACPSDAIRLVGKEMTAEEVVADAVKDMPFYKKSGGGITLSGGEPLLQAEFATQIAKISKANSLTVTVETSGYCKQNELSKISEFTDLFLFDFKHFDEKDHIRYTGVSNKEILANLDFLAKINKSVILRCPIIPGCNDQADHYGAIADLANKYDNIKEIHVEPYHPFGENKYPAIGMDVGFSFGAEMNRDSAALAMEYIQANTPKPVKLS